MRGDPRAQAGYAVAVRHHGVFLLLTSACAAEALEPLGEPPYAPPPESCAPVVLADPTYFAPCSEGGGIFGAWQLDEGGLPSYFYGLDQNADARASYPITEVAADGAALDLRVHWAAFGNRRINAMLTNDGYVEVVTQDRGVTYLNKYDPEQRSFAGGFSYIDDGEGSWCTAYRWRPAGALTERRFGMGYAATAMTFRELTIERVLGAPPGGAAALISEVTLENVGEAARTITHYEVWDVGRRPIEINWLVSGKAIPNAPATARRLRDERNALFLEEVSYEPERRRLGVRRSYVGAEPRPAREEPSALDFYPEEPFLALLDGPVDDVWVEQDDFFGGDVARPRAIAERRAGRGVAGGVLSSQSALGQPHVLVLETQLTLAPGERRTLRYVFGYARSGGSFDEAQAAARSVLDVRRAQADDLAPRLFYFAAERDPALQREMAWHSAQIEASVGYRDYWQGEVVPQGSAYLYLHGADGAARDLGLFAVPLSYTDPALAKAELELYMGIQRADTGAFSYAFQGHGKIDDAGIHSAPSDLPLFFIWALGEYLGATGDLAFLDQRAPFYPRDAQPEATTWDHVVAALRHQFDVVGTGEHGLIRVQTGDWSDGIVVAAPDRELAVEKGESVPNTQMAAAILPRVAAIVEGRDAALAMEIRDHVAAYRQALAAQWTGSHFIRAYYGDGVPIDAERLNLEAQVWALVGDTFAAPGERQQLVDAIAAELDGPLGVALWPGGEVWPAISALFTWGVARSHPELAWSHLGRNTMRAHALAHPAVWYGIWSAPDGLDPASGWAWASEVTPMRDFPVQNNNAHAMPILAALRVAGIEAAAEGLVIAPASAEPFALRSRLVEVTLRSGSLEGRYEPLGARSLEIFPPPGTAIVAALHDGETVARDGASLVLAAPAGQPTTFRISFE
jgi:hypothetical protein